jgi:hypothetical protein
LETAHLAHCFLDEHDACCGVIVDGHGYGWLVSEMHTHNADGQHFGLEDQDYEVKLLSGKKERFHSSKMKPDFCCDGCKIHFRHQDDVDKDPLQKNTAQYLKLHRGQRQHKPPIFKRIEQINHIMCFLHCILRTTGKLFMLFVANQCDTPAKATAVTEALQSWLSISIPPMKSCSNGPQKQV